MPETWPAYAAAVGLGAAVGVAEILATFSKSPSSVRGGR